MEICDNESSCSDNSVEIEVDDDDDDDDIILEDIPVRKSVKMLCECLVFFRFDFSYLHIDIGGHNRCLRTAYSINKYFWRTAQSDPTV